MNALNQGSELHRKAVVPPLEGFGVASSQLQEGLETYNFPRVGLHGHSMPSAFTVISLFFLFKKIYLFYLESQS